MVCYDVNSYKFKSNIRIFYHHPKQRWVGQLVKNDLIFIIKKYISITYIQNSVNVKLFKETQV